MEYQIETFIGLAEFRPTNTHILDVATKQIKVTLDKTNFFTVRWSFSSLVLGLLDPRALVAQCGHGGVGNVPRDFSSSKILDVGTTYGEGAVQVSTVAENDYTFLAYVNLRLVEVYNEDTVRQEFGDALEDRTSRTSSAGAAQYLQVSATIPGPRCPVPSSVNTAEEN